MVFGMFVVLLVIFFFFKQKTAYEMRISDWSSDVCSSDLVAGDDFAGDHGAHRIGWWTLTSFVPSGKVASTCTSWIISGTPAITWSRVTTCAPASIRSATLRPSRAPSRT